MDWFIHFANEAELLAEQYQGTGQVSFIVREAGVATLVVPFPGDLVRLRMHPGPSIRTFRCTGRVFDFSEEGKPVLTIELDTPLDDPRAG